MAVWPETRLGKATVCASVFACGYILAVIVFQVILGKRWLDWVRDISNALFAVSLLVLSIRYGGLLTDFYSEITGFGIRAVRVHRHGQDPAQTKLWMDRISGSEDVTIVSTLARGWFIEAIKHLRSHLDQSAELKTLSICLLDPFGNVWRSKVESGEDSFQNFLDDVYDVFKSVSSLATNYSSVKVQLYDTDPISCVIANDTIYLSLYLPRVDRKEVPEFTVPLRSPFGDKVYAESVEQLRVSAPIVSAQTLQIYMATMKKHGTSTREGFWSDPNVFCDFCKEPQQLPSEVSRRYPALVDGSRIAVRKKHFFVMPSLGQLVEDHALIVPHGHITSSAKLSDDALTELTGIFDKLETDAAKTQKYQLFFEHGVPVEGGGFGGCGICHCHIHSLPLPGGPDSCFVDELENFLKKKGCKFERRTLATWKDIRTSVKHSYLCLRAAQSTPAVFALVFDGQVESQLMRQFIREKWPTPDGKQVPSETWNWRHARNEEPKLIASTARLKQMLA